MAAALTAADAALILEGVEREQRDRILNRVSKSLALTALHSQPVGEAPRPHYPETPSKPF